MTKKAKKTKKKRNSMYIRVEKVFTEEVGTLKKAFKNGEKFLKLWSEYKKAKDLAKIKEFRADVYSFIKALKNRWMSEQQINRLAEDNQSKLNKLAPVLEQVHDAAFALILQLERDSYVKKEIEKISQPYEDSLETSVEYDDWKLKNNKHSEELVKDVEKLLPPF